MDIIKLIEEKLLEHKKNLIINLSLYTSQRYKGGVETQVRSF